jgi:hypothetical protein
MEPVTLSESRFDRLYSLVSNTLDQAVLDNNDRVINDMTAALVILDSAQYDDEEIETDEQQDALDFEE